MRFVGELFERIDITRYPVKKLILPPICILFISLIILGYMWAYTGLPVRLGMDFQGGVAVTITAAEDKEVLSEKFSNFPIVSIRERGMEKIMVFEMMNEKKKDELIKKLNEEYGRGGYEIKDVSPVFGKELQRDAIFAVIIAFFLMAFVIFLVFKTFVPSGAVILSAFSDILFPVACMNIMGMELSLGTVAALLMLIGYSVDSDILLTTNLLKKRGEVREKLRSAMKTGLTMTFTSISAVLAMFIVSSSLHLFSPSFASIPILRDISMVLLLGLAVDITNTWMLNAGILRWYVEGKERKKRK
ncbi:MAG: protein translocase subunit SecF [Candidatus Methanospirareceae archaeon]